jgi:hypothetical protein
VNPAIGAPIAREEDLLMAIEPCTDLRDFFRRQLTTAFTRRRLDARPETRDYIAGVLVDCGHHPPPLSEPLVVSLSEALSSAAPARLPLLLRTGDAALCLAGLFAPHVERTQGSLALYVHVGSLAYQHAAEATRQSEGEVPAAALVELGNGFPRFVDALQEVAESSALGAVTRDLVRLYDRMKCAGSERAAEELARRGVFPAPGTTVPC